MKAGGEGEGLDYLFLCVRIYESAPPLRPTWLWRFYWLDYHFLLLWGGGGEGGVHIIQVMHAQSFFKSNNSLEEVIDMKSFKRVFENPFKHPC